MLEVDVMKFRKNLFGSCLIFLLDDLFRDMCSSKLLKDLLCDRFVAFMWSMYHCRLMRFCSFWLLGSSTFVEALENAENGLTKF